METKHTAGPWRYHEWTGGNGRRFAIETADHRHGIASIAPNENASTLLTMEEHQANARLIAAAPSMLDALDSIDEACQQGLNSAEPIHWEAALQDIMGLARAAIAAAEGREVTA